ncbi:flagellar biosynthesis anti-sigma factor FlgM [Desulfolucanica intricata]|uniref:flagellar biosynthesis anti-sigma factor FlgM n=1 Tax=Desulfolucanica intricata TaxID=1285191 RepID=UPI00083533E0|nr:flagellar biosynthesis anti-sigma factor FlgM [Desulfolucanica intricata]
MKISQGGFNPIKVYTSHMREKDNKKPEAGSAKTDKLELSPLAKELHAARARLAELPEVREDLVAGLKQRIKAGTYNPSGEKIAAGIIEERLLDKKV